MKKETKDIAETTTVPAVQKKSKQKKEKKAKKTKLPSMFKKKYSERKLQKKLLKRIYIPDDRQFVQTLFIQEESTNPKKKGKYYIPRDSALIKKDSKRLKTIAKQVKKQKGRVRFLPLIASISFIFLLVSLFLATKNIFIKKVIKNLCETQFEAKCDIAYLDLRLLDSSFTVKGFEIANKDKPMKNLFSLDSLVIDFDLTQLLKSKFVADELSVEEIAIGSDRTYDGSLSEARLNKIRAKKEKREKKNKENKEKIQQSLNVATDKVKTNITDSIVEIFETFSPKNILERCYAQMITPNVAKKVQDETIAMIEKWKETPERVMEKVNEIKDKTDTLINFDFNSIRDDPKKIKDMLEAFEGAFGSLEIVINETEKLVNDVQNDFSTIENLTYEVRDSVVHDMEVTTNEIEKLTSFRLPTGQEFIASTIDIYGHELLGKYYPYLQQGIDYVVLLKNKQVPTKKLPKKEKPEKKIIRRAAGRDVYFMKDRNPKFWIKKVYASGFNMSLKITDIANDMNKTERPAEAVYKFTYDGITHGGKAVVDIRNETNNPLVYAEYTCDGSSFEHSDNIPGVPQIKTDANYLCSAKVIQDEAFVLSGVADLYNLKLTTPEFEPTQIYDIYSSVLSRFDSAKVGLDIRIGTDNGLTLHANSDLDQKIAIALRDEITQRLTDIRKEIEKEISAHIKSYLDKSEIDLGKFADIKDKLLNSENTLNSLQNRLEEKQKEFTNKMEAAQKKVQEDIENKIQEETAKREEKREQAKEEMKKKNEERKQAAEDKAEEALKDIFGGLKRP